MTQDVGSIDHRNSTSRRLQEWLAHSTQPDTTINNIISVLPTKRLCSHHGDAPWWRSDTERWGSSERSKRAMLLLTHLANLQIVRQGTTVQLFSTSHYIRTQTHREVIAQIDPAVVMIETFGFAIMISWRHAANLYYGTPCHIHLYQRNKIQIFPQYLVFSFWSR